ncbi:MAG: outer membrane protein assembly factor BamD [Mariprofundus sp.]
MISKLFSILSICLVATMLYGCASDKKEFKNDAEREYDEARHLVDTGGYGQAALDLDHFASNYPYSKQAIPAELLRLFAAYKDTQYILSETLAQRFIDRHPTHKNVDYARYMLAMSQYKQHTSAEHDPTQNKAAIKSFLTLIKDHPESSYAKQGKARLQQLYNTLGKHELNIGKFYFEKERFVAAANRFQEVIRRYQTTPSIEEALYYLAASYAQMEMTVDANQTAMLLRHNYPKSEWSSKAERFR